MSRVNAKQKQSTVVVRTRAKLFIELVKHIPGDWNSMVDLAQEAEVSPQTLWNWLYGTTWNPQITTLTKVASALGYDIELVKRTTLRIVKR